MPEPKTHYAACRAQAIDGTVSFSPKPWPDLPNDHYYNTAIDICSVCGIKIYGGQKISYGWTAKGAKDIRCGKHGDDEQNQPHQSA